jgi:aromatic ring hydroxylase
VPGPEVGAKLAKVASRAPSTKEHLRLIAVAADMVKSPFGKRSQLYERLQSGDLDHRRQRLYSQYKSRACGADDTVYRGLKA